MKKKAALLLFVGLLQMTGDLLRIPALQGLGAATGASPAPKVFTAVRGMEAYSTRFYIVWTDRRGVLHELQLTPDVYQRFKGPYNRRNVYGAVLAGGPVMVEDEQLARMYRSVSSYALCGEAPVLRELGIDRDAIKGSVLVRYEPLPGGMVEHLPRVLQAPCHE